MPHRKRTSRRRRTIPFKPILFLAAVLFIVILIITAIRVRAQLSDGKIAKGVQVDGVDLSGMTTKEAEKALSAHLTEVGGVQVHITAQDAAMDVSLSELGLSYRDTNAKKLAEKAYAYGRKGFVLSRSAKLRKAKKKGKNFAIAYDIDKKTTQTYFDGQTDLMSRAPVNASLVHNGDSVTVQEGQNGYVIDQESTIEAIRGKIGKKWNKSGFELAAVITESKPDITADMLAESTSVLGIYTTYYGGGDTRSQNIETGAAHINGSIVKAGEEFDVNAAMAPYTEENGYGAAGSYENGKVVDSMGGGICQVSSTLYNAVLHAELTVTERYEHSMLVSYVEPGQDAAIADDVKNLKFVNSTDAPIVIEAVTSGGYLTMRIYGKETRDPNREVSFESETTSTEDYKTKYITSSEYELGTMTTTQSGQMGESATLWKIVTVNGEVTERTEVNTSHYAVKDKIVTVGIGDGTSSAAAAISSAVSSQDEAAIKAAVAGAVNSGTEDSAETSESEGEE